MSNTNNTNFTNEAPVYVIIPSPTGQSVVIVDADTVKDATIQALDILQIDRKIEETTKGSYLVKMGKDCVDGNRGYVYAVDFRTPNISMSDYELFGGEVIQWIPVKQDESPRYRRISIISVGHEDYTNPSIHGLVETSQDGETWTQDSTSKIFAKEGCTISLVSETNFSGEFKFLIESREGTIEILAVGEDGVCSNSIPIALEKLKR